MGKRNFGKFGNRDSKSRLEGVMTNLAPLSELPRGGNDLGGTHRLKGGSEWGGFAFSISPTAGGNFINDFIAATPDMGEPAQESVGGRNQGADIPEARASLAASGPFGGTDRTPGFSRTIRAK